MIGHHVVVDHVPYSGDTIFGLYDTFQEARDDVERRTTEYKKPNYSGDDYGIDTAVIELWMKDKHLVTWRRNHNSPLDWIVEPHFKLV